MLTYYDNKNSINEGVCLKQKIGEILAAEKVDI